MFDRASSFLSFHRRRRRILLRTYGSTWLLMFCPYPCVVVVGRAKYFPRTSPVCLSLFSLSLSFHCCLLARRLAWHIHCCGRPFVEDRRKSGAYQSTKHSLPLPPTYLSLHQHNTYYSTSMGGRGLAPRIANNNGQRTACAQE